jgi:CHRD domain-containing protein
MVAKGRRPLFLAVLVVSVLGALLLAPPASAAPPLAHLEAQLTGEKEVPGPGDPNGRGEAEVKVFKAKVCYTLKVQRIAPATAAHIHRGVRGVAGPIVVPLKPPTDGSSSGCVAISQALSKNLREHPARYYVNVHNRPFPDGAVRGQLHHDNR